MNVIALVAAAGRGSRFSDDLPKQWLAIGGRAVVAWSVERLLAVGVSRMVVALPADDAARAAASLPSDARVTWYPGGASRQESVTRCLRAAPGSPEDLILVHDAARPAVALEDIQATLDAAAGADGAVLGRALSDTLKQLVGDRIAGTLARDALFRAETPQIFRRAILEQAIAQAASEDFQGTDEASLVERLPDMNIRAVFARWPNPKLTEPADLPWIESLLLGRQAL